ncbi:MAG: D-sedoheptulose 7-phosphate isomerase [Desulfovibrionaceae bacterium]|nr:D-sedoheptulose 7-phosphate isomerase [Desulfovibrionaceae bacterium]
MADQALTLIIEHALSGAKLREQFFKESGSLLQTAALKTAQSLANGGKILICGNGGSAADSQHVAGEFVNRFLLDRPALPCMALTTDTSTLTAISNDFDFSKIFSRQVEAFGQKGDILVAISTSGNSPNVLAALEAAKQRELFSIALTGQGGGKAAQICDLLLAVPSAKTPLIQEVHLACEHLYCQLVDYYLFENPILLKS